MKADTPNTHRSNNVRWNAMWQAYMDYMEKNKRRPSKYYIEDRALVNWYKHYKKLQNKGLLSQDRQQAFNLLVQTTQKYRRLNQYSYASTAMNPEVQAARQESADSPAAPSLFAGAEQKLV